MPFNVMEHTLVPKHTLLSDTETKKVLTSLKISKDQLPKIKISDPCVKILETTKRPIKEGMVVEVTRTSETAGQSKAYRLVVRR
jgi:DNA-directed RNA polymerase subunit H